MIFAVLEKETYTWVNYLLKSLVFNDLHETRIRSVEIMNPFSDGIEFKICELRAQVRIKVTELGRFDLLFEGIKTALPTTYALVQVAAEL